MLSVRVRPSVCLSVCDVCGLWSHRLEFFENISRLVSVGRSLSADPNIMDLPQREQPEIWPKVTHPLFIWALETFDRKLRPNDLQIAQRSQWRAYRKPPSLFRMVASLTPYDLPFPQMGVLYAPWYANGHISATSDPIYCTVFRFGGSNGAISGYIKSKLGKFLNGRISAKGYAINFMLRFYGRVFRTPILYSMHRAVIFAIAQLSCYYYDPRQSDNETHGHDGRPWELVAE